ncbi:MAG: RHS repeat-associated core domain-containing protein, partial [Hyphomicrobium sp.]
LNARFPGQWFQVESGLHYNWHRHYDPTIGRYTQPDPLGFVDGPSVYAYARNAPGEVIDPTGLFGPMNPDRSGFKPPQSKPPSQLHQCRNIPGKGGPKCEACLNACAMGGQQMQKFCRGLGPFAPGPVKAGCWAAALASEVGCKGYCYRYHCD